MASKFFLWLCYVHLLVWDSDKSSYQWDFVYCSLPAQTYQDLVSFQNENLKIISIFNFHPMNYCTIAEIDEPEHIKASIKVLIVGDNWLNFSVMVRRFIRKFNLVAYNGFDIKTTMEIAVNKQVDIIIVNTAYSDIYHDKQVNGVEIATMLKINPETAQIPVILKLGGQIMVGDRERYFAQSGANDAIRLQPESESWELLVQKIKDNLSTNDSNQNTAINLKNKVSSYQPFKKQKELILDFIELKVLQSIIITARCVYLIFEFLERLNPFRKNTNN